MTLLRARGLRKRYGDTLALDNVDLTLESGRILGLIGPNGSGKTTALKSVMGLCKLDAGELSVFGLDPFTQRQALMQRTTSIADVGTLPRWMKIADLLSFMAAVNPRFDTDAALRSLDATRVQTNKRVRTLSKGMHVQLHLALVLASNAELLVLDEPTLGLDIGHRQRFYDTLVGEYFDEQRSIILTTHELREVEHLLTDVVFIHNGQIKLQAPTDTLAARFFKLVSADSVPSGLPSAGLLSGRKTLHGSEYIYADTQADALAPFGQLSTPNLAELFMAVTQQWEGPR